MRKVESFSGDLYPTTVQPLYNSNGYIFDKKYNTLFKPVNFTVPSTCKKVRQSKKFNGSRLARDLFRCPEILFLLIPKTVSNVCFRCPCLRSSPATAATRMVVANSVWRHMYLLSTTTTIQSRSIKQVFNALSVHIYGIYKDNSNV